HVLGYSTPVHARLSLDALEAHLHSLPDEPDAIPYLTSYYAERWGFCLPHRQRKALVPGEYEVCIDADLVPGHLELGGVILPGRERAEVLLWTSCCPPSCANNELSGPVVASHLARLLATRARPPRLTYRFVFVPETIGAIAYLSRVGDELRERLVAGYV